MVYCTPLAANASFARVFRAILRHGGIFGVADEAVSNTVQYIIIASINTYCARYREGILACQLEIVVDILQFLDKGVQCLIKWMFTRGKKVLLNIL